MYDYTNIPYVRNSQTYDTDPMSKVYKAIRITTYVDQGKADVHVFGQLARATYGTLRR